MTEREVIEKWCADVRFAYQLARGDRLNELRGKRTRRMDARGLHPFSQVVGHVEAMQELCPDLRELGFDAVLLRLEAGKEADKMFREELVEEALGHRNRDTRGSHPTPDDRSGPASLRDLAF